MPTPQRLGKYQIRRRLGAGAMGIVYEGFDPLIERSVALKVIRPDEFGGAEAAELRARLKREAQAAGRLAHPGIVAVYEYGEDDNGQGAFIAMEMVRGGELKAVLDTGQRFTPPEAVRVMRAVLAALQHAHERGVVHRDIKPSNVFLQDDGEVKVADFGVARLESSDLTQTGAVIGTPSYMSPEQLLGQPVDGRSDLFSCGVVLYQLLTGEKPFTGSVTTVMHKVLHEQATPPSALDTTLIPRWDAVIERALAKQPADRYQSAAEFSRAIAAALAEMPPDDSTVVMPGTRPAAPAKPPNPLGKGVTSITRTGPGPAQRTPPVAARTPAAPSARAPATAIATALAAVVVAAGGAAWWFMRGDTGAVSPVATRPDPAPAPASAPAPAPPTPTSAPPPAPAAMVAAPTAAPLPAPPRAPTAAPAVPPQAPPQATGPRAAEPARAAAPAQPADPWQVQRALIKARVPLTAGHALRLLLDVRSAEERELLADFDRMLADAPAHSALAIGVRNGLLRWRTQSRAADVGTASRLALQRCSEGSPAPCRVVLRDGEFSSDAFLDATSSLGLLEIAAVRDPALRSMANSVKSWREQVTTAVAPQAAAPAPPIAPPVTREPAPRPPGTAAPAARPPAAAASVAPPVGPTARAPSAAPAPSAATAAASSGDWARAEAALRGSPGPPSLADALIILLGAQSDNDIDILRRFGSAMKRLRWISALAMGESRGGVIAYGYASGASKEMWARDGALQACARATESPCTVVFLNGDVHNAELAALAGTLASRSQATVRRAFIESANRTLARGSGF